MRVRDKERKPSSYQAEDEVDDELDERGSEGSLERFEDQENPAIEASDRRQTT